MPAVLLPLVGAVIDAGAEGLDKDNLNRTGLSHRTLMTWVFIGMAAALAVTTIVTGSAPARWATSTAVLLGLVVVFSFAGNAASYAALPLTDVSMRQPLHAFTPILAAGIGWVVFPDERAWGHVVALVAGTLVVFWGCSPARFVGEQRRGVAIMVVCVVLNSAMPTLYGLGLAAVNPPFLALVRVIGVLMLTLTFQRPPLGTGGVPGAVRALVSGTLYAASTVIGMYSIGALGVVQVSLVMLAAPLVAFTIARLALGEHPARRDVVTALLLALIGAAGAYA